MPTAPGNTVTFTGTPDFDDLHEPVPGKSEWGMDTLTRTMAGKQPLLAMFVAGLNQGSTYNFRGTTFYLQTWECDNARVYPAVTLNYKGLTKGVPQPKASGQMIEQSISLTTNSPQKASRDIRYITRQTNTLYIAAQRPAFSTYGLDVDFEIVVVQSVIRTEDGALFYGNAPAGLVTALTPATVVQSFMECNPVVGSIYFECRDCATKLYMGN